MIAEITSKILLGAGLWVVKDHLGSEGTGLWWWMITMTVCVTFLEVGSILGIAYVDKYVRVAQIVGNGPPEASKPPEPEG